MSSRLCSWAAVIPLVHITSRQRNQFVRDWPRTVRWWHTVECGTEKWKLVSFNTVHPSTLPAVLKMTYTMLGGTLNPTHSLTHITIDWIVTDCAWIPKRLKQLYSARPHVSGLGSRSTHSILEWSTSKHLTVSRVLVFSLTVQSPSTSM